MPLPKKRFKAKFFSVIFLFSLLIFRLLDVQATARIPLQLDNALSKHLINQLLRDDTGFMWVATDAGVFRYDGYEVLSINKLVSSSEHLPTVQYAIALGLQGDLWLLSETGLFCYSTRYHYLKAFKLPASATGYSTRLLEVDKAHNRLWVVNNSHSVIALTLDKGAIVPGSHQHFPSAIGWLSAASDGSLWLVANNHQIIHLLAHGKRRYYHESTGKYVFPVPDTHPQQFVSTCAQYAAYADGRLYETRRWLPAKGKRISEWNVFHPQWQLPNLQWSSGNILVRLQRGHGGTGQIVGSTTRALHFENYEDYDIPLFYHVVHDVLDNEWYFSPSLRGCYKHNTTPAIQRLGSTQDYWYSSRAILRLPDKSLLIGAYTKTLYQPANKPGASLLPWTVWEHGQQVRTVFHSLLALTVTQLLGADDSGFHLIDTRTHLRRRLGLTPTDSLILPGIFVKQGAAGKIWAGAKTGLFWLDSAHPWLHPYQNKRLGQALQTMQALAPDAEGALWLATTTGLYHLNPNTGAVQHFAMGAAKPATLPTNQLLSLQVVGSMVWVGTRDQGLLLVDPHKGVVRHLTTTHGLPSNTVCSLLTDLDANLWLGTYEGIVRYRPQDGNVVVLTKADGLVDNECNYQSAFRDEDGSLFFGGIKGVSHIWPKRLEARFSAHRRLVISKFIYSYPRDTSFHFTYPGQISPDTLRLNLETKAAVQVALTDYINAEATHYWYKIHGASDTAWHNVAPSRTIKIANLPQGFYTLLVKSRSSSGIWSANRLAVPIKIYRAWWPWQAVLGAVASLAMTLGMLCYRWYSQRKQKQQQLRLRGRLAHDLHDELGALLVRASMQAELLREDNPGNIGIANNLLQNLQTASQAMRDIVWSIDPHNNFIGSLVNRFEYYLHQLANLTSRRIEFRHTNVEEAQSISPELRQHLYYIFKEAVTNSLRHAHNSTLLLVSLEQDACQLLLCIQDDGPILADVPTAGTGLRSMHQRARIVGGNLKAMARPEGGFKVELRVSLRTVSKLMNNSIRKGNRRL